MVAPQERGQAVADQQLDMHDRLIVFAKNPVLGKVKTRLAATVGNKKALEVYRKLLLHTRLIITPFIGKTIFYFTDTLEEEEGWSQFDQRLQQGATLGVRMSNAFNEAFEEGTNKVIIIGTDCYDISSTIIAEAFDTLNDNDVVIGPAEDGGYYLLGMKKFHPDFFKNKRWSTETVFIDTLEEVKKLGLKHKNLQTLMDIDTEKELVKLGKKLG